MEIALSRSKTALVDADDYEAISRHKWHCLAIGYAARSVFSGSRRAMVYMHRQITGASDGQIVDHINGNTLDNRKENLRIVDKSQNNRNKICPTKSRSGYRGVIQTPEGRWKAYSKHEGKFKHLGHHDSPESAALARDAFLDSVGDIYSTRNFKK